MTDRQLALFVAAAAAAFAAALPSPAQAQDRVVDEFALPPPDYGIDPFEGLTESDLDRLYHVDAAFGQAVRAGLEGLEPIDLDALRAVFRLPTRSFDPAELVGDWQCNFITLKTGSIIDNAPFTCRIEPGVQALSLDKPTGFLRLSAVLRELSEDRFLMVGATFGSNDEPRVYTNVVDDDADRHNLVGWATMRGPDIVIEMPYPRQLGDYAILRMTRP